MKNADASVQSFVGKAAGLCLVFSTAALLAGCGPSVGRVSGKVTADGKPVTGGTIIFSPGEGNRGAAATVNIKEDGTYTTDAALVGKINLLYNAPSPAYPKGYVPKPSEPAPESPYTGLVPKVKEVEIKSGSNTIDIVLDLPKK